MSNPLNRLIRRICREESNRGFTPKQKQEIMSWFGKKTPAAKTEPVKPEHFDGEKCNLPIYSEWLKELLNDRYLVYTGEFRWVKYEDWFIDGPTGKVDFAIAEIHANRWILRAIPIAEPKAGETWHWDGIGAGGFIRTPRDVVIVFDDKQVDSSNLQAKCEDGVHIWTSREHLFPIEPKPQWRPDDLLWCERPSEPKEPGEIVKIIMKEENDIWYYESVVTGKKDSKVDSWFRPVTNEDWVVEIADVKVTARERGDGFIRVWFNDAMYLYDSATALAMREMLKAKGVPIMPFGYGKK